MATETRTALSTQSATPAGEPPAARRDQPAGKLVWQINMRRLLWSAGVAVVVVPALYFWHDYQHARHAQAILANARRLYDKQNWNAASAAFHQYLRLVPDDAQALIQRAQTFEKLPMGKNKRQQAASLYLEAFRANPGRYDLL